MDTAHGTIILLVDDDAPARYLTARVLRSVGYQVKEAATGSEALEVVAQQPPDVVILDIQLPGLRGDEVLRRLKSDQVTAAIPVMYFSGVFADDASIAQGLEEGADAYLTKPAAPEVLLGQVKALVRLGQLHKDLLAARQGAERRAAEWEAIFSTSSSPTVVYDAQGRLMRANPAALEAWGFNPLGVALDQVAGRLTVRHPDGRPVSPEELPASRALKGEAIRGEHYLYTDARGQDHVVRHFASPLRDGDEIRGAVAIWHDITQRERLRDELERQRALLETVLEQLPVGVGIAEAPTGRLLMFNEQARRIWRATTMVVDDAAGYGRFLGLHPDGRPYAAEDWQLVRALQGEVIAGDELAFIRADGSYGFMRSSAAPVRDREGRIVAAVVAVDDITQERDARQAASESERRYSNLFETMSEAFYLAELIADDSGRPVDWRYLEVNPAYEATMGLRREEVVGRTLREVFPETEEFWLDSALQAVVTGKPARLEAFFRATGRYYEHCFHSPRPGQIAAIFVDTTDRRVAELERARLQAEALAAERARTDLAQRVGDEIAHRVKNNLAMASGVLQMQQLREPDPHAAEVLREAAARIRTFAAVHEQIYASRGEDADLLITLQGIGHAMGELFSPGDGAEITVEGDSFRCHARAATNLSVIANELITNALKYGGPDGEGRRAVEVRLRRADGHVRLTVWNSGPPLAQELDPAQSQTMGLRLVQDMVVGGYRGRFRLAPSNTGTIAEVVVPDEAIRADSRHR